MKVLLNWFSARRAARASRLFLAKQTMRMLQESTNGKLNHFYNHSGELIRERHNGRVRRGEPNHLIAKYPFA